MKSIPRSADWLIGFAFFIAALAIRLPEFMQIPRLSDEGFEALWGLDIALGKHLPLMNITPQIGPIFPYLMAVLFRVFGIHPELPRLATTVFSALTVAMTYALGRNAASRSVGGIAAAFAATNRALILFGHYGWSASLAPFFVTAAFAALYAGMRGTSTWLLPASGCLMALAIQAHATSAVLLLGIVIAFLHLPNRVAWLTRRDALIGVGLFILGCLPMLIAWTALISSPSPVTISGILAPTFSPSEYTARLVPFLRVAGFFLGGGIGDVTWLLRIQVLFVEGVFIASLVWAWYAKRRLVAFSLLSAILVLPIFISEINERYYLYLLPLAFVAIGMLVEGLWNAAALRFESSSRFRRATRLTLTALVILLVSGPVLLLGAYYADIRSNQLTNAEYFRALQVVHDNRACGEGLFVENAPQDFSTAVTIQSWYSLHALDSLLTLDQCSHTLGRPEDERTSWLFVSEPSMAHLAGERFQSVAVFSPPLIESQPVTIFLLKAMR